MKAKITLWISGTALGCMALTSCGGSGENAQVSPPQATNPPTQQLDTAEVLAIVQTKTSDTSEPFQVDNAAVTVTPVGDETGEPITVNGT